MKSIKEGLFFLIIMSLCLLASSQSQTQSIEIINIDEFPIMADDTETATTMQGNFIISQLNQKDIEVIIRVEFNGNKIAIVGCNYLTATYSLTPDFKLIDEFSSTRKFCPNDLDPQVVQALKASVRIKTDGQSIIFYSAKNDETLKLILDEKTMLTHSTQLEIKTEPQISKQESQINPVVNDKQEPRTDIGELKNPFIITGQGKQQNKMSEQIASEITKLNVIEIPKSQTVVDLSSPATHQVRLQSHQQKINTVESTKIVGQNQPIQIKTTQPDGENKNNNILVTKQTTPSIATISQENTVTVAETPKPQIQINVPANPLIVQPRATEPKPKAQTPATINTQSETINGNYNLFVNGLDLNVKTGRYSLTGCNTHTFSYTLRSNGEVLYGKPASTKKACSIDFDHYYLDALLKIKTIFPYDKGYNCVDQNGIIVLRFESTNKILSDTGQGQFKVLFPTVDLTIDDSFIRFEACNINTASYTVQNGLIKIDKFISTLRSCDFFDFDNLIVQAFSLITSFEKVPGFLKLKSGKNYLLFGLLKTQATGPLSPIPVPTPLFTAVEEKLNESVTIINSPTPSSQNHVAAPKQDNKMESAKPTSNKPLTPVVVLPTIKQISLKGNYRFSFISIKLAAILVSFDENFVKFSGCNMFQLPYAAYDDGNFDILEGGSLTHRTCQGNNDDKYVSFLRSLKQFERKDTVINFLQENRIVAYCTTKISQQASTKLIPGIYGLELAGLDVLVQGTNIVLTGCNNHTIPFASDKNGFISFGAVSSTRMGCINNDDAAYLKAITASKRIIDTAAGISFYGDDGFVKIEFIELVFSATVPVSPLEGQYKAQLPSNRIKLTVSDKLFVFEGCSRATIDYAIANGGVTLGKLSSTKKLCEIDYDSVFLNSILQVKSIVLMEQTINFLSSQGEILARSIKYTSPVSIPLPKVEANPNKTPTKIISKQITLPSGPYAIDYSKKSGIKSISCSISGNKIVIKGCRSYTISYSAYADGTVKFEPESQSSISSSCATNNDNLFLSEFRDTESFTKNNKNINFFDFSKKANLNLVYSTQREYESRNNYHEQYSQFGFPFYSKFTSFSPFAEHQKILQSDWFGLGSRSQSRITKQPPKTIAQAGGWQLPQSISSIYTKEPQQGLKNNFESVFKSLNLFNWFGHSTQKSKQSIATPTIKNINEQQKSIRKDADKTSPNPEGAYIMALPKIELMISQQSFTFKGCNNHRIPCSFRDNKIYFGKPVSTTFKCNSDHALNFINVLPKFVVYRKNPKGLIFFNHHLQSLFMAQLKSKTSLGPKIYGDIFGGIYEAELPEYNIEVKENVLKFQGCEVNAVSCDFTTSGFVNFKKRETRTKGSCTTESDDRVVDYLRSSSKISFHDDRSYSLHDDYGNQLFSCRPNMRK